MRTLIRTRKRAIGNTRNAENSFWWAWRGNSTNSWVIFSVICELNVGSVRPITGRTRVNVRNVCKIINKVRRSITSEIACRLDFSYGTCQRILKHVFNMRMVSRSLYRGCLPMNRRRVILLSLKICLWTHTFRTVNTHFPYSERTHSLLWRHTFLAVNTQLLNVNTHLPYYEHTTALLWTHNCWLWTHTFLTLII